MVKPVGPACNLGCAYCYYLGKDRLLYGDAGSPGRISDELLERFIREYVSANQSLPEISFAWQGGEPTMLGVEFFRKAVELEKRHVPPGVRIANSIQTNGTLLDDELARFFHDNEFLVGVSLDGPRELHDANRRDKSGGPTFDRVMAGVELLRKHRVQFNALVVVSKANATRPADVYRFLRDQAGVQFMQFIPCVERLNDFGLRISEFGLNGDGTGDRALGIGNGAASNAQCPITNNPAVTEWSVGPEEFGSFLCGVFDEWLAGDVGRIFVQTFDTMLGLWMGLGSSLCVFAPTCGLAVAMEPDGAVYACDHFVYPEYRLGRLGEATGDGLPTSLVEMVHGEGSRQRQFGRDKADRLPDCCRQCRFLFACNGECPKNRFALSSTGQPGLNYLCPGLKRFFTHIDPWMKLMAAEVKAGRPAANVMNFGSRISDCGLTEANKAKSEIRNSKSEMGSLRRRVGVDGPPTPNGPCPCGSGRKFKRCCGRRGK